MLDPRLIRERPDEVRKGLLRRGLGAESVDEFLASDERHRKVLAEVEALRQHSKEFSRNAEGDAVAYAEARKMRTKLKALENEERKLREETAVLLDAFPNIPLNDVPDGKDERDNIVVRGEANPPAKPFPPQDHLVLAEAHGLVDMAIAAKVAGTRFSYLKREAAILELALVRYAFDMLSPEGFIPVIPPTMIRPEVFRGMGRLAADQREERYFLQRDNLYLVGSAEHTMGPMHMDE
ncbi:MAG: serine--tRNA ligase, partial [Candidatus Terrybacteria bacterium]|nr:serine--tRNA ligase [Candidatus Terrybacteria bacterium]